MQERWKFPRARSILELTATMGEYHKIMKAPQQRGKTSDIDAKVKSGNKMLGLSALRRYQRNARPLDTVKGGEGVIQYGAARRRGRPPGR